MNSELMPIITLYPPWANWVGLGWKTIETRLHQRFKGLVGRRIAIHVALKWDDGAIETARPYLTPTQRAETMNFLCVGGAICWTALVRKFAPLGEANSIDALIDCGPGSPQRYGLFLSDVKMIEAIPAKGRQGIWYHKDVRG